MHELYKYKLLKNLPYIIAYMGHFLVTISLNTGLTCVTFTGLYITRILYK